MKLLLVFLSIAALAYAHPTPKWTTPGKGFVCMCPPEDPICASNGETYYGECNMECANNWIKERLYMVHSGPCP